MTARHQTYDIDWQANTFTLCETQQNSLIVLICLGNMILWLYMMFWWIFSVWMKHEWSMFLVFGLGMYVPLSAARSFRTDRIEMKKRMRAGRLIYLRKVSVNTHVRERRRPSLTPTEWALIYLQRVLRSSHNTVNYRLVKVPFSREHINYMI